MTDTRDRIVDAAVDLFRVHGYTGTAMQAVVAAAGAPNGSLYHHFRGGKEELAAAAIERAGVIYRDLVLAIMDTEDDLVAGTRVAFDSAAVVLHETGYVDACPVGTVALEVASTSEPLREACQRVFDDWTDTLTARLVEAGAEPAAARSASLIVIAVLEGAFMLSRTARSPEPMRACGDAAVAAVSRALGRSGTRPDTALAELVDRSGWPGPHEPLPPVHLGEVVVGQLQRGTWTRGSGWRAAPSPPA